MIERLSCVGVKRIKEGVSHPFVAIDLGDFEGMIGKINTLIDHVNTIENPKTKPKTSDYTEGNTDDINKAIEGLTQFCHSWCMDCEKTKAHGEPMFRCGECIFNDGLHYCAIKIFVGKHATSKEQIEKLSCMSR